LADLERSRVPVVPVHTAADVRFDADDERRKDIGSGSAKTGVSGS
jgi:hypothetical protein